MSSTRQPLLTISPSHHDQISQSSSSKEFKNKSCSQTTPTLPRRERLASFSRLLKRDKSLNFTRKTADDERSGNSCYLKPSCPKSPIKICISPCSPATKCDDSSQYEDILVKYEKGYLSPNRLPFSPRILDKKSPIILSPSYRHPSPLQSPLYNSDGRRNFLGRGSFGKVSLCRYKDTNFAVKIIHQLSQNVGEKNLVGIRHPHLVEIFYISTVLDRTIIFMEFAGHCNLQQILDTKSELDFRRKLSFCIQIASGLSYCHKNQIIHGDVKPANVIISPMGICKLGDFGHSSRYGLNPADNWQPHTHDDVVGTVVYAAPEVLRGFSPTPQSDVYSFGILLWQVETRCLPFAGEHPHVIIYKVANYGIKPKFKDSEDPMLSLYIRTAKSCWLTTPEERITTDRALINLQDVMQMIKMGNKGNE